MTTWVIVLLVVAFFALVFWIDRNRRRHGVKGPMGRNRNDIDPGHWTGGGS